MNFTIFLPPLYILTFSFIYKFRVGQAYPLFTFLFNFLFHFTTKNLSCLSVSTHVELEVSNSTLLDAEAKGQAFAAAERIVVADAASVKHIVRAVRIIQARGAKPPVGD